ncbi:MAG TPA: ParB/RepB/Spo0J family partition protein [Isosphaeraceae bacterium]
MNKKRLGRGLAALLGSEEGGFEPSSLEMAELLHIPVDQIDPNPFQPRRQFDPAELAALADSLRQHGMLQPVIVRPAGERYQLIAGERRLRASIEAHLHEIPARVLDLDDQRVCELAMVENLQRQDLNALEKASAFRNYLDTYGGTQEELADRLGLHRTTVSNLLRLLELPEEIKQAVLSEAISPGHARTLLALDDADERLMAFRRVVEERLSVRQTEALVKTGEPTPARTRLRRDPAEPGSGPARARPPHVMEVEAQLRQRLGSPVLIRARAQDRGQIVIDYNTRDEFDRIVALVRGAESPAEFQEAWAGG